jgi:hypothetical protein
MTEALPLSVRRMPTPYDLGLKPSAAWNSSHTITGLKESVLTDEGGSLLLQSKPFLAAPQAKPPEASMPDSILLPVTARKADALFATPQLAEGTDLRNRRDPEAGVVSRVQNLLLDDVTGQLGQQLVR